ncbi:MAG: hypothetical protein M3Q29_01090 [Chloroflexota bacterium]|nr:hypothetical protein [Chloroflexota bacterium]
MAAESGTVSKTELEAVLSRDWMPAKQAARLLDRSTQMVWIMAKTGKVDTLQTPGGVLYSRQDIDRVLTEREGQGR